MKKKELEKGVWYVTTRGRRMSLGYCWLGGDDWAVVSWGASFNRFRLRLAEKKLLPYLVKTDLKRDIRRKREDTYRYLMDWVNGYEDEDGYEDGDGDGAGAEHLPVEPPVKPAPELQPTSFALGYLGSRLDPVVYLMVLDGKDDFRWVSEPRFATTFPENEAVEFLRSKLGVIAEYGTFTINWDLVKLMAKSSLLLGSPKGVFPLL